MGRSSIAVGSVGDAVAKFAANPVASAHCHWAIQQHPRLSHTLKHGSLQLPAEWPSVSCC